MVILNLEVVSAVTFQFAGKLHSVSPIGTSSSSKLALLTHLFQDSRTKKQAIAILKIIFLKEE